MNNSPVTPETLHQHLLGDDVPGSSVLLTVKKASTNQLNTVVLVRMPTADIADKRRLFELFTALKAKSKTALLDSTTLPRNAGASAEINLPNAAGGNRRMVLDVSKVCGQLVDESVALWSKMVFEEARQKHQIVMNAKDIQHQGVEIVDDLQGKLDQLMQLMPGIFAVIDVACSAVDQFKVYEDMLAELRKQIAAKASENDGLYEEKLRMAAEIARLRGRLDVMSVTSQDPISSGQLNQLREQRDNAVGEAEFLKGQVEELRSIVAEHKILTVRAQESERQVCDQNEKLKGHHLEMQNQISGLQKTVQTKSMDFEAARTELAECNVQLERLKAQLNSASDLVKAQTEAFKIADSKREEMRSELARVQALLAESKSQLQQSQKESQAKLNSVVQSHDLELNEHVRTKAQKMSIEERCKAFEKSLTMREGEVSELKAENARLEEILRLRREAEQKALKERIAELEAQISPYEGRTAAQKVRIQELEALLSTEQAQKEKAVIEAGVLKERIAELEAQISPYEGRTAAQKARIQELEALLSTEQAQKQKAVNEAGALKYELEELKRGNVVLADKIKMHEAEISSLHSLHSQCEGRSKTQQARIEELESLLRAEQVQKQKAANDAVALKYELDELKKNVEDYLARLKEMSEALRTAREELERTTLALTSAKVPKKFTKELGKPKI